MMMRLLYVAVICVALIQAKDFRRMSERSRKTDVPFDDEETYFHSGDDVVLENVLKDYSNEFNRNMDYGKFDDIEPLMLRAATTDDDSDDYSIWDYLEDVEIFDKNFYDDGPTEEVESDEDLEETIEETTRKVEKTSEKQTELITTTSVIPAIVTEIQSDIEPEILTTPTSHLDTNMSEQTKEHYTISITSTSLPNEKYITSSTQPSTINTDQQPTSVADLKTTKHRNTVQSETATDTSIASELTTQFSTNAPTIKTSVASSTTRSTTDNSIPPKLTTQLSTNAPTIKTSAASPITRSTSEIAPTEMKMLSTTDELDIVDIDTADTTPLYRHRVLSTTTTVPHTETDGIERSTSVIAGTELTEITSKMSKTRPTTDLTHTSKITALPTHAPETKSLTMMTEKTSQETTNPVTVSQRKETLPGHKPTLNILTQGVPITTDLYNNVPSFERSTTPSIVIPDIVSVTQKAINKEPEQVLPVTQMNKSADEASTATEQIDSEFSDQNDLQKKPRKASISTIILIICLISLLIVLSLVAIVIIIVRARVKRRGKYEITSDIDSAEGVAAGEGQSGNRKVVTVQYNDSRA